MKLDGCMRGCTTRTRRVRVEPVAPRFPRHYVGFVWLGCRDSNPNYLIQSQASYR